MRIGIKLSLVVLILALLLIIVAGFSVVLVTRSALESTISDNQLNVARETLARIDRVIYERYLDIQDFAGSTSVENFLTGSGSKDEVNRRLLSFFETSGPWDIVKIVGLDETILFASDERLLGSSIQSINQAREAYLRSLDGEVFASDVVVIDDTGYKTIFFSSPIRNRDAVGRPIIGIAIGQFSWSAIEEILESSKNSMSDTHLFSKDNRLISSSVFRKNSESSDHIESFDTLLQSREFEKSTIVSDTFRKSSLVSYVVQAGYLDYKGNNWKLVIETPTQMAFASVNKTVLLVLSVFIPIVFLSAGILIYLVFQFFIYPLKSMTEVALQISKGDMKKRIEIKSNDEVAELGNAFNTMTDTLLKVQASIEQKVEERTRELEEFNKKFVGREFIMIDQKKRIQYLEETVEKLSHT